MSYAWKLIALTAIVVAHLPVDAHAGCRRCCRILCRCSLQSGSGSSGESAARNTEASASDPPVNNTNSGAKTSTPAASDSEIDLTAINARIRRIEVLLKIHSGTEAGSDSESALLGIALNRLLTRLSRDLSQSVDDGVDRVAAGLATSSPTPQLDQSALTNAITAALQNPQVSGLIQKSILDSYQTPEFKAAVKAAAAAPPVPPTQSPPSSAPQQGPTPAPTPGS